MPEGQLDGHVDVAIEQSAVQPLQVHWHGFLPAGMHVQGLQGTPQIMA